MQTVPFIPKVRYGRALEDDADRESDGRGDIEHECQDEEWARASRAENAHKKQADRHANKAS